MSHLSENNQRQRQREHSRTLILRAAIDAFAESGFDSASLADIAHRAGIKKALVQYHFSTKERLWQEAVDTIWEERDAAIADFLAQPIESASSKQLRDAFTTLVDYTRRHPQWLGIMLNEARRDTPRRQWLIEHHLAGDYERGQAFVELGQRSGMLREGSPLHLLHLVSGALTYNLLVAPLTARATGTNLASGESIATQVDLLLSMLAPAGR